MNISVEIAVLNNTTLVEIQQKETKAVMYCWGNLASNKKWRPGEWFHRIERGWARIIFKDLEFVWRNQEKVQSVGGISVLYEYVWQVKPARVLRCFASNA
jgi:hypothetical protein